MVIMTIAFFGNMLCLKLYCIFNQQLLDVFDSL